MTSTTSTPTITKSETYRGVVIALATMTLADGDSVPVAIVGGRQRLAPAGGIAALRKIVDRDLADDLLRPELTKLAGARPATDAVWAKGWGWVADPQVGTIGWVYATGRSRRGLITKVTAKRVTISYTTPSSAGRIFHKTVSR